MGVDLDARGLHGGAEAGDDLVGPLEGLGNAKLALASPNAGDMLRQEDGARVRAECGAGVIGPAATALDEEAERRKLLDVGRAARSGVVVRFDAAQRFGRLRDSGHGADGDRPGAGGTAANSPTRPRGDFSAAGHYVFATVALLLALAMFVDVPSFFLGQQRLIPAALRRRGTPA